MENKRHTKRAVRVLLLTAVITSLALGYIHCGATSNLGAVQPKDICNCLPIEPDIADYRHLAKHVPLPDVPPQEITVDTILSWSQGLPVLPPDAPRTGRELQVFHIAKAYLQKAAVNSGDCDVTLEISATPDKAAPRVIVETPVDSEYCSARKNLQAQLSRDGFALDAQHGGELAQALAVEVLGMAFEDFEHDRGSAEVSTLWELHPATVNLLP